MLTTTRETMASNSLGAVAHFTAALKEFRKINPDSTINQALIFMHIAQHEGVSQKELMKALDMNDGTVSRICAMLSERGNRGAEGLRLIKIGHHEDDYRRVSLSLTPRGKQLFRSVLDSLR